MTTTATKSLMVFQLIICSLVFSGCASVHRQVNGRTAVLSQPFVACNSSNACATVQAWEVPGRKPGTTSQLTPVGCGLHTLVTLGHIAWECRAPQTTRGRWLWKGDSRRVPWSDEDWKIAAFYYGKPYLDAPKGWRWVCHDLNVPDERCYIDKQ